MSYQVLIIPEAVESSDGRSYPAGLLTWRESIPLMFTDETSQGHDGAFQVGVISNLGRRTVEGETWIVGDLTYDIDAEAAEAERLVAESQILGVSADVAEIWEETGEVDEFGFPILERVAAEIVGATQLPMPAFATARILTEALVAALVSDISPDWFADPSLEGPTPLTVEGNRVYGHLALWSSCHTGYSNMCVTPPKGNGYSMFHTGLVVINEREIPVGHITLGTGHASMTAGNQGAIEHYDNTGTCAADVCVGEDEHGIWVAGALRDGVDADVLRAASLSGDWRKVNGHMELLAALAVNVPGFPIPRLAASAIGDEPLALVAAGIVMEEEADPLLDALEGLAARVEALESRQFTYTFPASNATNFTIQAPFVTTTNPAPEMPPEVPNEWGKLAEVLGSSST